MTKKNFELIIVFLIIFFSLNGGTLNISWAADDNTKELVITGSLVNVRNGPGQDFQQVAVLAGGSRVPLLDTKDDWHQISYQSGKTGWVASWLGKVEQTSLLEENSVSEANSMGTGIVNGTYVNIRSGPGVEYNQINRVQKGQELMVLAKEGDWFKVQLENQQIGWIADWLLDLKDLTATILVDNVNIRKGAGSIYPVIKSVNSGEVYSIIAEENQWLQLKFNDGTNGWVASWLVQVGTDMPTTSTEDKPEKTLGIVIGDVVNVRAGSDTSYDVIDKVTYGRQLEIVQEKDGWYQVKLNDQKQGWIAGWLLDVNSNWAANAGENNLGEHSLAGKLILVDPGHGTIRAGGWSDPGAIGPTGLKEVDVVTYISQIVKQQLEQRGAQVVLTRTGKTTELNLQQRAEMANDLGADIFVSIHANASFSSRQGGTTVFYYANEPQLSQQLNARRLLAHDIQRQLVGQLKLQDLGIRQENFAVLRHTTVPSVLVEVAFISNPTEEKLLADPSFREKAATAIVDGISQYFKRSTALQ